MTPADLVVVLANEFGLTAFYKDQSKLSDDLDDASDEMLLDVMLAVSRSFSSLQAFFEAIHQALNEESDGERKPVDDQPKDQVTLSTIHRSKGKEFASVVYFHLSENEKRDKDNPDLEEERHVAYVGATRSKDNLLVRYTKGKPSGFLLELALNPQFRAMATPALLAQKAVAETKRSKLVYDLQLLQQRKEKVLLRYPELNGQGVQVAWSPDLLSRFRSWWRENQLRGAVQKLQEFETRIRDLAEKEYAPMDEQVHTIQSEIEFRARLEKN